MVWIIDLTNRTPKYNELLLKTLLNQGIDVKLKTYDNAPFISLSKHLFLKRNRGLIKRAFIAIEYYSNLFFLLIQITISKPEIVHFQWLPGLDNIFPMDHYLLQLIPSKIKLVHTVHNVLPHYNPGKRKTNYKKHYKFIKNLIFHNHSSFNQFYKEFDLKVHSSIIEHGLMFEPKTKAVSGSSHNYSIIKLLLLGPIREYKGYLEFARHFNSINPSGSSLRIVGYCEDPQIDKELREMENVIFYNRYLDEKEFIHEIDMCDFGILPYKRISDSGLFYGFLSRGTPVILSDLERFKELYYGFENLGELIFEQKELGSTRDTIFKKLHKLNYLALCREMELLKKDYQWSSIGRKYKMYYSDLI